MKFLGYRYNIDFVHNLDGKGEVLSDLKNSDPALGLVDEDPTSYNKYPQLSNYEQMDQQHNLKLFKHKSVSNRYYIEIPENLEIWFMRLAQLNELELQSYQVLDRRGKFKKKFGRKGEQKLHEFFTDICDQPAFRTLEQWLKRYA